MSKITTVCQNHKHGRILWSMNFPVKATVAPKPRTKESRQMAILFAGILVIFAVTQLFTFDEFITIIPALELPLGPAMTYLLAPLIVATEVFALPFLLGMSLSVGFRWLSMFCSWFVAATWLFISFWTASVQSDVETMGLLGGLANLEPGWWAVFIAIALCILTVWTSWGLWPGKRAKK